MTILRERMHQIDRFRDDFGIGRQVKIPLVVRFPWESHLSSKFTRSNRAEPREHLSNTRSPEVGESLIRVQKRIFAPAPS